MPSDPTPAVPPMDAELDALVEQYARLSEYRTDVAVSDAPVSAVEMVDADLESVRLEIWSWVVAYGDRRAEEARGKMVRVPCPVGYFAHPDNVEIPRRCPACGCDTTVGHRSLVLPALSSPAPEGGS